MNRTVVLRFAIVAFLCGASGQSIYAQTACDAEIIGAMKTNFKDIDSTIAYKSVQKAACESNYSMTSAVVPYAGFDTEHLSHACSSHDERFFLDHYKELAGSMVPEAGFETLKKICLPQGLTLRAHRVNNSTVSVSATWSGALQVHEVSVTSLTWSSNIENCKGPLVDRKYLIFRPTIGNGSTVAQCTRKSGTEKEAVGFALQTDHGAQLAMIPEKHSYTFVAFYSTPAVTCQINGRSLTSMPDYAGYRDKEVFRIKLDNDLREQDVNTLHCVETGNGTWEGHWCYKYRYSVLRDEDNFAVIDNFDCSPQTPQNPRQPDDILIPY
jgi:hypothetical protein